jgi:FkbM family methyltransferase
MTGSEAGRSGGGLTALRHLGGKVASACDLVRTYVGLIPKLGLLAATALFLAEASERRPLSRLLAPLAPATLTIKPEGYRFPLTLRRGDTDNIVVRQMLALEQYKTVSNLAGVRLIIDCGANIGASAYYLLHRYPDARLVAIEPDPENVALCRRNLHPFGDRALVLHAAVWSECRPLRIAPASKQRGAWARSVEPASAQDADVDGLTIPEILIRTRSSAPIDLLKMDVEGAEIEIFRDRPAWLAVTRHVAIELHDRTARAVFDRALDGYHYDRLEAGELTVVTDLRPLALHPDGLMVL